MTRNCIAIIPARGGSVRIPRKNIIELNNKPAITYPIKSCIDSNVFSKVYVSTEDDEIANIASNAGANVAPRPNSLADSKSSIHDVVRHLLHQLIGKEDAPDYFCIVYATAVLLESNHLVDSHHLLNESNTDAVLAVRRFHPHPYKSLYFDGATLKPTHPEHFRKKSQEFPNAFAPAGVFHWMKTQTFLNASDIMAVDRLPYELPAHIAVDMDEPEDIELISLLLTARNLRKG